MARLREVFPNVMALDYEFTAAQTARARERMQVREAVDPDALDTVELFAGFYEEQTGGAMDEAQAKFVFHLVRETIGCDN